MPVSLKARKAATYDAIVIGSGISGGWAAKELCEKGLKTLVLERGRDVAHLTDYPTMLKAPWEMPHHGKLPHTLLNDNPVVARCYAFDEFTQHFFVKDTEHPYVQDKPFDWIRGYQVGGKSLIWARQTQRWSDFDFEGPARDGFAVDWPIRYRDLAPWYSYVETFVGISGNRDGIPHLPDGEFLPPMQLNCVEKHLQQAVASRYTDRQIIAGRCAHLTQPKDIHLQQGRAQCQYRHLCYRGCPYGAYFSSNASTLPAAARTGNMTLRPHSVVHSILYDDQKGKATGVRVIDAQTKEEMEFYAPLLFVNAACLNTNLLLLNSTSGRFPNGLGNDNGLLGTHLAFHNYRGRVMARYEGFADKYYYGRRPNAAYMPRFRNVARQETDFLRGYAMYVDASRGRGTSGEGFGATLKENMSQPGNWHIYVGGMGETIPKATNRVWLSKDQKDAWGIPQLVLSVDYDDNDEKMLRDMLTQGSEMLDQAGFTDIRAEDTQQAPGLDIHEMGGCRMGNDPKTSLLNRWNQLHACPNVFVTDGACMTSVSTQNPSLTFMALTARAVQYAVAESRKGG